MSRRATLVVCEDAGAAAALRPVVSLLRRGGDRLQLCLGPEARRVFADEVLASDLTREPAFADAALLLHGTTSWGDRIEARAVQRAREVRVPSLGVLDFWSNYEARLSFPGPTGLGAVPDHLAVIDDEMASDLVEIGIPRARVTVSGSPAFDDVLTQRRWRPMGQRVLFLSQPLRELYGTSLGYTEDTILRALAPAVERQGAELVIRAHPRENPSGLAALARELPGRVRLDDGASLDRSVEQARAVVGMTSIALLHAALAGAPVLSLQIGGVGSDPLPSNRSGLTVRVTSEPELEAALGTALSARAPSALPAAWQGGAAARIVALCRQLEAAR